MEGLDWQTVQIPFGYGTEQQTDRRVLNAPELVTAKDVTFGEFGGLQTRKPLRALDLFADEHSTAIDVQDVRRIERFGSELLLFTKDRLYSRRGNEAWTEKGTHLAIATTETPRFVTTGDQIQSDRAELAGITVYSWHEIRAGSNWYGYIAAVDNATGNVILPPYELPALQHIRLVALETKILLIYYDGIGGHYCYAVDPADPSAAFAGPSTTVHTGGNVFYDACKVPGADQAAIVCRKNPTTSYQVVTMTAALVRTQATKARTATSTVAIAVDPTGTNLQVVRRAGGFVKGDLIDIATLADVFVDQAIGTGTPTQIAAEFSSVPGGGGYTCHVFWDVFPGTSTNTVTTANVVGAEAVFVIFTTPAARAFAHDGRVYVWLSFHEESSSFADDDGLFSYALQNTYFLYRDDGFLCAKAVAAAGGGGDVVGSWLPGVQSLGSGEFAWAGLRRRIIRVGGAGRRRQSYAERSPQDIVITFDSNEARRCVRLGGTLYITGGEILQYDGVQLTEVGFHIYPFVLNLAQAAGGSLDDGTYAVKQTLRWDNAVGEIDRSTAATVPAITVTGGPKKLQLAWETIPITHKLKRPIAFETWRTLKNPEEDSPFYLVSDLDPGNATNPNRYLANDTTVFSGAAFEDTLADSDAKNLGTESQAVIGLEPLAPPAARIIAANADRVFLAGVAGDPDRVWYSRLRGGAEVASFHDALTIPVPRDGGDITAITFLAETLIVFRERAIYMLPGEGSDNAGTGTNYGPARIVSLDVGAQSAEALAIEPRGIVFHSEKGKYLLDHGGGVSYIGGGVSSFDDEPILAVHVLESEHQIRWVTPERVLVLDYLAKSQESQVGQWAEWTIPTGLHATIWNGTYLVLAEGTLLQQRPDFTTDVSYGLDIETAFIKMNDLQGGGRVRRIEILGEYRGAHWLEVQIFRDYETAPFQTVLWQPDTATVGAALQVKIGPKIQRCEAIKLRIRATDFTVASAEVPVVAEISPSTEALKLSGLALEVGLKRGLNKRLSAAQRT